MCSVNSGYQAMTLVYFILSLSLLYWFLTKKFNYWRNKNAPSVTPSLIVGNTFRSIFLGWSNAEFLHKLYQRSKTPVLGMFLFHKPCLLIKDPQIIKNILIRDFQHFCDRNIFVMSNSEWKKLRTKIHPIYSSAKLKEMTLLIEKAATEMTDYLLKETENQSVIEMKKVVMKYTVDVILSSTFGVKANSFQNDESPFYVAAQRMFNWEDFTASLRIRCYFWASSWVKIFRINLFHPLSFKFLIKSFWKIVDQRAESRQHRNDMIDILLELKKENDILDCDMLTLQAVVFFGAGFETSSSTLGFAMHELALHPEIQTKLRNEINEVSQKCGGINYEAVSNMEYLDMVIQETLRKYPTVPILERKSKTQYIIPETGTVIEKNTPIFIPLISLHNDAEYFPDPEMFNPQRFSVENKAQIKSFTYLPFGEGPRNCIGARFGKFTVKIGLATILQNFILEPCPPSRKEFKFNPLAPLSKMNIKVRKVKY